MKKRPILAVSRSGDDEDELRFIKQLHHGRKSIFLLLLALFLVSSKPGQAQDSTFVASASTSIIQYHPIFGVAENKTSMLDYYFQSELALNIRLVQLVRYASKRYLSSQEPMEAIAHEIDGLPIDQKNRLPGYAAAGSVGVYSLRIMRDFLAQNGLFFVVPSQQGLVLHYHFSPLKLSLRFAMMPDAYYRFESHFWHGRMGYPHYQHEQHRNHYFSFSPRTRFRINLSRHNSLHKYFTNGMGIQYSRPNVYFFSGLRNIPG